MEQATTIWRNELVWDTTEQYPGGVPINTFDRLTKGCTTFRPITESRRRLGTLTTPQPKEEELHSVPPQR